MRYFLSAVFILGFILPLHAQQSVNYRGLRYPSGTQEEIIRWQEGTRSVLFALMQMSDLVNATEPIPFEEEMLSFEKKEGYLLKELQLKSTGTRTFKVMLAVPTGLTGPAPAVVAIHGHGGKRRTPFESKMPEYKEFGSALAKEGFVVISTDVGQHEVYEPGRTLMGERLWDVMRCVDYLVSMKEVDPDHIGCAGLSLGGEMTMWLGGMDTRLKATMSAGFLTTMDSMEQNHCMCWKFPGLRELVEYTDIYALTAPRALQCQNGLQEGDTQFPVPRARKALKEIEPAYADFKVPERLEHVAHEGGHEIALTPLLTFMKKYLQ